MAIQLNAADKALVANASPTQIVNALSRFRNHPCPPWLRAANPYPDGTLPKDLLGFTNVSVADLIEITAVRGPLHAIDGWNYLGRALSSLVTGQAHSARHLAYYAELRAALSILASSGIGVFDRRNATIDAAGARHVMSSHPTHTMAWLALSEWSTSSASMERLIQPVKLAGHSLVDPFRAFFPAQNLTAGGELMLKWGFDLQQGAKDRDERNWSSYQPTALGPITTTAHEDSDFLRMFWEVCRPGSVQLERHLLRIVLETEAAMHNHHLGDYAVNYEQLREGAKATVPFNFLTRVDEPDDHEFIRHMANAALPAPPYAMICRAGLLLKLASGMTEENFRNAGVQTTLHLSAWWQALGESCGLWGPGQAPNQTSDLWADVEAALEDSESSPRGHRHEWLSGLSGSAMHVCQAERAALWGLFS